MRFLRSNTAVIITVGPFYDKTDGVTIETALTITNERITLTADTDAGSAPTNILDNITGATSATANDLNYITGNDAGMMQLELAAADVNRVGRMFLSITDAANHVPVFHEFFVLPQAIYDWLTGVIVPLPSNMTQILGTAVSTPATAGILDVNTKNMNNVAATAITTIKAVQGLATDGVVPTVTNLTNAPTAGDLTATMKASVNTEVDTALADIHLDHLIAVADPGSIVANSSFLAKLVSKSATPAFTSYDNTTDALEAIRDKETDIETDTAVIGAAGAGLTAIPWNASWDAEVESEVNDAINTAISELGVAAPTATPTLRTGMMLMYMALRNKLVVQTSGTDAIEIYNDAGTKICAKAITDNGTDYTEDEMA